MRIRALALLALALQLQGCFVFDEIDKGQAMMSKTSAAKEKEAAEKAKASAKAEAGENAPNWWEKAGTLAPGEGDATIVGCRLSGKLQFMREADCLTRGGRPQRV